MKKTLAIILSALMVLCMMPSMAFATETPALEISGIESWYEFTGVAIEPVPTVTYDGETLTKDSDYTVSYTTDHMSLGAEVTVTVTGVGDDNPYKDKTAETTFKIQKTLKASDVTLNETQFKYDGKEQKPTITVSVSGVQLSLNDYTVEFPKDMTSPGEKEIKIKGNEKYRGEIIKKYYISNFTVDQIPTITTFTYTGNEIKPTPIVRNSAGAQIYSGYTVTYKNNIGAKKSTDSNPPTVIVTGNGSSSQLYGSFEIPFTISQRNLANERYNVTIDIPTQKNLYSFSGVTVTYNGKVLDPSEYSVTDQSGNTPTTYRTAKIVFTKNYSGSMTQSYTYNPNATELNYYNTTIAMYPGYAYYNGTKAEMSNITVTCNGQTLYKGSDYDVRYRNNDKIGTATMIIVGRGSYTGTYEQTFQIYAGKMSDCTINFVGSTSYPYTGIAIRPTVTVKCGSITLPTSDYTVTYLNNTATGTATVRVSGTGNFTGYKEATFTIYGTDINTCTATLSQEVYNYTGRANTPTVTVKKGYTTLTLNRDYTVKYEDNTKAGTGKAIITGKGAYSGTITKEFTIVGKENSVTTNYTKYTKYLTSDSFSLGAKSPGDGYGFKYTSDDTSVATVSTTGTVTVIGTGVAKIKVETVGTSSFNPASKEVTVTVKPVKPSFSLSTPDSRKIKVTITKVKGATKYQVRYGRQGKYYSKYITHLDNGYSKTSTTIGNRKSGTYYFIKVRAYKTLSNGDKVWGNWTTLKKIRAR